MPDPTILIVDDADATRSGLADLLRLKGYEALQAACAEDALAVLSAHPETRLVILDLQMPGAGGLWFREQQVLNRKIAHVPVAVFTGGDLPSEAFGFCARLKKPFSVDELLHLIEVQCDDGNTRISA